MFDFLSKEGSLTKIVSRFMVNKIADRSPFLRVV